MRKNKQYRREINGLYCCNCYAPPPNECAHIRKFSGAGVAQKPKDKGETVPLCNKCHSLQHKNGELSFWGGDTGVLMARGFAQLLASASPMDRPIIVWRFYNDVRKPSS